MMGTLATALAGKKIPTPEDRYWADVEGDLFTTLAQYKEGDS